jgi:hypothetical protein
MAKKKTTKQVLAVVQQQPPPGQGQSSKSRRRRNRRKNRAVIARPFGGVKKMARWPTTRDGAAFLRANLDPFSDVSLRSIGVPDGFGGDTLKHCNTMEITVKPSAAGNINFTVFPSASTPLVVSEGIYQAITIPTADATNVANGTTVIDLDMSNAGTGSTGLYPGIYWPTWATSVGNGDTFGPYGYKSQRVVSMGLEWRYTGTALSDKGVCTAAVVDGYMIPGYVDKPAEPASHWASTRTRFMQRGDTFAVVSNSEGSLSNQPRFVQQTMHSSEGAGGMIVLTSAEEGFALVPTICDTIMVNSGTTAAEYTAGTASATIAGYGIFSATPTDVIKFPILPWQNLRPVGVAFTGLDPSISIVLRLKQRVEATVDVNSPFQQFSDKSPTEDSVALGLAADISKTLPVMVPVTMNGFGDWWRKIMSVISSAGKIVGGIGIPMVSQVATGVGGLADILGSFADL